MTKFPDRTRDVFPRPVIPTVDGEDVTKENPLPISVIDTKDSLAVLNGILGEMKGMNSRLSMVEFILKGLAS